MNITNVASYQGTYAGGSTYALGDVVFYSGSSYVSLIDSNIGNQPDTHPSQWAVFAAQGATGSTGSTGATGATGPAGPGMRYAATANSSAASLSLPAGTYRVDVATDSGTITISGTYTWVIGPLPGSAFSFNTYIITLSSTQTISTSGGSTYRYIAATPVTT